MLNEFSYEDRAYGHTKTHIILSTKFEATKKGGRIIFDNYFVEGNRSEYVNSASGNNVCGGQKRHSEVESSCWFPTIGPKANSIATAPMTIVLCYYRIF